MNNPDALCNDWNNRIVNPTDEGVYLRLYPSGTIRYNYWDGREWYANGDNASIAKHNFKAGISIGADGKLPWKGPV